MLNLDLYHVEDYLKKFEDDQVSDQRKNKNKHATCIFFFRIAWKYWHYETK